MKKRFAWGQGRELLWACVLLLFCACHRMPQRQTEVQPAAAKPYQVFDHRAHAKAFDRDRIQCDSCHVCQAGEPTPALSLDGRGSCHECHVLHAHETKVRVRCRDCHADLKAIEPADHAGDWATFGHGRSATSSGVACFQCHTWQSCAECHSRQESTDPQPP
jgi:hypothetical protein